MTRSLFFEKFYKLVEIKNIAKKFSINQKNLGKKIRQSPVLFVEISASKFNFTII